MHAGGLVWRKIKHIDLATPRLTILVNVLGLECIIGVFWRQSVYVVKDGGCVVSSKRQDFINNFLISSH